MRTTQAMMTGKRVGDGVEVVLDGTTVWGVVVEVGSVDLGDWFDSPWTVVIDLETGDGPVLYQVAPNGRVECEIGPAK